MPATSLSVTKPNSQTNMDISIERCDSGMRTAKREWQLTHEEDRPAGRYMYLVDTVDVDVRPHSYEVTFHERGQTLTQTQSLN